MWNLQSALVKQGGVYAVLFAFILLGTAKAETVRATYHPPADRTLAVEWLGELKATAAIPSLIALCADPDGGVRYAAVVALGSLGDPRAAASLAKLAADPKQERVEGSTAFGSNQKSFSHYRSELPAREDYDVRHAAQRALLELRPARADAPLAEPTEAMDELHRALTDDPVSLAEFGRRGWGPHADLAYRQTEAYRRGNQLYNQGYQAIKTIAQVKTGAASARALMAVFGCGVENLELEAAGALDNRTDGPEVMALVRKILADPELSPLTLSACLSVLLRQDPAAARALGQRLLVRMAAADATAWERFPYITSPYLQQALTAEDLSTVTALHDAQHEPDRQAAVAELGRRLAGGLPPPDDLFDLENVNRLPPEQRKTATDLFLRELNKPEHDWHSFKAAYQLGRLRTPEAVPGLLSLLDHPVLGGFVSFRGIASWYPTMAAWALVQIADPACLPALRKKALQQAHDFDEKDGPDPGALLAYGSLAGEEAIDDLATILTQPPGRRFAAIGTNMVIIPTLSRTWGKPEPREQMAFPSFNSVQEAAAYALSRIDTARARDALVGYLDSENGKQRLTASIVEAIFRAAPARLDAWSQGILAGSGQFWGYNSLSTTAVAVRLRFFPEKSVGLVRSILADTAHPLHWAVIDLLRSDAFKDEEVTLALIRLLARPAPPPATDHRLSAFDYRLELLDAIGRQGGPTAITALLQVAEGADKPPATLSP